jgi:ABC-type proline/glycine betaine transport system ATPase subunit
LLEKRNITELAAASYGKAMMLQRFALCPHLSALENVAFSFKMPLELQGLTTTESTPAIYALGTVTTVVSLVVMAGALALASFFSRLQKQGKRS